MDSEKKIIKWFIFGGTSTFLAFFLPAYLWAKTNLYHLIISQNLFVELIILDLFLGLSLWHGKFRADTMINDFSRQYNKKKYLKLTDILFRLSFFLLLICNIGFIKILSN